MLLVVHLPECKLSCCVGAEGKVVKLIPGGVICKGKHTGANVGYENNVGWEAGGAAHPSLPVTDKAARHKWQLIPLLLNC